MDDQHYDIIYRYRELKEDVLYPYNPPTDEFDFPAEREQKRNELANLRSRIENEVSPYEVNKFKSNVLHALEILLRYVKKNKSGYPLDRNQGLILENYLFDKVAGVITSALKNGYGVSYPEFFYEVDGDFDETRLRSLLERLRDKLQTSSFQTYFELEEIVERYIREIGHLADEAGER